MNKLKILDLFSGIGGFSLGLERTGGFETTAFCEIDPHCHKVLNKNWPNTPIITDIKSLNLDTNISNEPREVYSPLFTRQIDLICGGFPCQDISVGGKKRGLVDSEGNITRSGLWFEYKRLISEIKPKWVIIENVDRLIDHGLKEVLYGLSEIGYDAEWSIIRASDIGAKHKRARVWILAYPSGQRFNGITGQERLLSIDQERINSKIQQERQCQFELIQDGEVLSNRFKQGLRNAHSDRWQSEPSVGRVVNGLSNRLHESERKQRIKQLGNSIVPQIAELIGEQILLMEKIRGDK